VAAQEDYDDPAKVEEWLADQARHVEEYLARQRVKSAPPENHWELAPYVAVWQITRGWAISGDLPTDYVLDETILTAREAMRFFAAKFAEMAECMTSGRDYHGPDGGTTIGDANDPKQQRRLGGLLRSRAGTLADFADDDRFWPDDFDDAQEATE
jgi:hypothetical protein